MAIKGFATNNLVKSFDTYIEFMSKRSSIIKTGGFEPTEVLFFKKGIVTDIFGKRTDPNESMTIRRDIKRWHCIVLSYDIWYELVQNYVEDGHGSIQYKKFVNVPDSVIKDFKKKVEDAISNAKCDYGSMVESRTDVSRSYNGCRYLAEFWTYLDLIHDCKTQRFFPNNDTIKRASKIFKYRPDENPFIMNGRYRKSAIRKEEEKPVEEKKMPGNIVDILETRIEDLGLTMRSRNALVRNGGCKTVGDIVVMNVRKMLKIRNLGLGSIKEIVSKLKEFGIEYKTEPNGSLNWDELPFVPKKEESVIDIAEEAAKRVEEEAKLEPNKEESKYEHVEFSYDFKDKEITPNKLRPEESVINISRNEYEEFIGLKKKHDELLKTAQEQADRYDELLKQKLELDACNARLKDDILMLKEKNEVLKDQVKSSTDIIATFHKGIELMRQHGISDLSTNINGFSVDIKQKAVVIPSSEYSIRTRPSNQKFGG